MYNLTISNKWLPSNHKTAGRYVAERRVVISDEAVDTNSLHNGGHFVQ